MAKFELMKCWQELVNIIRLFYIQDTLSSEELYNNISLKGFSFLLYRPFLGFIQREGAYANGFLVNEFNGELCVMCVICLVGKMPAYVCRIWYEDLSKIEKDFSERMNISHFWRWEVCGNWYSGFRNQYLSTYIHKSTSLEICDVLGGKKCLLMFVGSGMRTSPKLRKPSQKEWSFLTFGDEMYVGIGTQV